MAHNASRPVCQESNYKHTLAYYNKNIRYFEIMVSDDCILDENEDNLMRLASFSDDLTRYYNSAMLAYSYDDIFFLVYSLQHNTLAMYRIYTLMLLYPASPVTKYLLSHPIIQYTETRTIDLSNTPIYGISGYLKLSLMSIKDIEGCGDVYCKMMSELMEYTCMRSSKISNHIFSYDKYYMFSVVCEVFTSIKMPPYVKDLMNKRKAHIPQDILELYL